MVLRLVSFLVMLAILFVAPAQAQARGGAESVDWGVVAALVIAAAAVIGLFNRAFKPLEIYRWFNWLRGERKKFFDECILRESGDIDERTVCRVHLNGLYLDGLRYVSHYSVIRDGDDARFYVTAHCHTIDSPIFEAVGGYLTHAADIAKSEKDKHVVDNVREAELLIIENAKKTAKNMRASVSVERLLINYRIPEGES